MAIDFQVKIAAPLVEAAAAVGSVPTFAQVEKNEDMIRFQGACTLISCFGGPDSTLGLVFPEDLMTSTTIFVRCTSEDTIACSHEAIEALAAVLLTLGSDLAFTLLGDRPLFYRKEGVSTVIMGGNSGAFWHAHGRLRTLRSFIGDVRELEWNV